MKLPLKYSALAAIYSLIALPSHAWSPGTGNESATTGFSVDTQSRNDVISFWHCVYMESEDYQSSATSSQSFKDDVQRRINYYRAMAGLNADIDLTSTSTVVINGSTPAGAQPSASTTKQAAAQAAADMISDNSSEFIQGGGVATGAHDPHNPPTSWISDSSTARNGAYYSNLAVGVYGPGAIDAYILEDAQAAAGSENDEVGHRRLILRSSLQEVATGDTTAGSNIFSANALYVIGNLSSSTPAQFVAWPNAGYIPEAITPERWSLSYPNADFSTATVTVTDANSANVPITIQSTSANYGDNTIIWEFTSSIPSAESTDQSYHVTVSNIDIGGTTTSHSYQVTIINPDRLLESTDLSGSTSPPDSGANYFFDAVEHAEDYHFKVSSLSSPSTWVEKADSASTILNETTLTDSQLRTADHSTSSSLSLRLAFTSNTETFSAVELKHLFIPRTGSQVNINTLRGVMLSTTTWALQIRSGNGAWQDLKTLTNPNSSTSFPLDSSFKSESVNIPVEFHDKSASLRIVYRKSATDTSFTLSQSPFIGVFADDISLTLCDDLNNLGDFTYSPAIASHVSLNNTTAGETLVTGKKYLLSFAVTIGCKTFPFGNSLEVTPVAASSLSDYVLWSRSQYAIIGDFSDDYDQDGIANAVERVFGLNPMDATDGNSAITPQISGGNIQLSHAILPGESISAEYSSTLLAGSWSPATVTVSEGVATAFIPVSSGANFLRWVIDNAP